MIGKILAFVVPLGFDTAAVAIALGLRGVRPLPPAFTFALFEAVMPLVGLYIGYALGTRFTTAAVVLGGLVLIGLAAHMFRESLAEDDETDAISFASLRTAALAGLGISMDELAIGFPMGAAGLPIAQTVAAIAVQAFVVTAAGVAFGSHIGQLFGRRASRTARIIAAIGFALLGVYMAAQRFIPGLQV